MGALGGAIEIFLWDFSNPRIKCILYWRVNFSRLKSGIETGKYLNQSSEAEPQTYEAPF